MDYLYTELPRELVFLDDLKIYYGYSKEIPTVVTFEKIAMDIPNTILTDPVQISYTPNTEAKHLVIAYPKDCGKLQLYSLLNTTTAHIYNAGFDIKSNWVELSVTYQGKPYYLCYSFNAYQPGVKTDLQFVFKGKIN